MYVTQFGPVTNKVWLDWLEQAYGPQEHRDCGTLGKYHGSFMWSISVVHSGRFNNLTLTIFFRSKDWIWLYASFKTMQIWHGKGLDQRGLSSGMDYGIC